MAKLIVAIEFPKMTKEELEKEIEESRGTDDGWWNAEDPGRVIVDGISLPVANCDDSFYAFELIGVEP